MLTLLWTVSQYLHLKPPATPDRGSAADNPLEKHCSAAWEIICKFIKLLISPSPVKTGQKCDQPAWGRGPEVHGHSH